MQKSDLVSSLSIKTKQNKEQFEERLHPDQKTCDNAAKLFWGETK